MVRQRINKVNKNGIRCSPENLSDFKIGGLLQVGKYMCRVQTIGKEVMRVRIISSEKSKRTGGKRTKFRFTKDSIGLDIELNKMTLRIKSIDNNGEAFLCKM